MPAGVRLLVMITRVLLGTIAMDPVNGYSHVARAHPPVCCHAQQSSRRSARPKLRVATRHSIRVCALGPVSSRKGEKDEGADTYTALVSWLIAGGGFVHEAVTLTPNDGTGGRGLVAARNIARGEKLIVVPEKAQFFCSWKDKDRYWQVTSAWASRMKLKCKHAHTHCPWRLSGGYVSLSLSLSRARSLPLQAQECETKQDRGCHVGALCMSWQLGKELDYSC